MAGPRKAATTSAAAAKGARILIVEARYYTDIADALLDGARRALDAAHADYDVVTVPGALEIPAAIAILCDAADKRKRPYDGAVALGCVIRGETYHFEIVAGESSRALMDMSVARRLPLGNGILTVETKKQAVVRARPGGEDKGAAAADAALALVALKRAGAAKKSRSRA